MVTCREVLSYQSKKKKRAENSVICSTNFFWSLSSLHLHQMEKGTARVKNHPRKNTIWEGPQLKRHHWGSALPDTEDLNGYSFYCCRSL